jgi:hypothetical protein
MVLAEDRAGHMRYRFMVTLREYAQDRLLESGEQDDMSRAHAEYFKALADEAETEAGRRGAEGVAHPSWQRRRQFPRGSELDVDIRSREGPSIGGLTREYWVPRRALG